MKKYMPNILYSEVFWMYWCAYCVISSFASVFLLANGYSNTEIGILIALGNIFSVVIQPITANIADRSKKINVVEILILISIVIGLFQVFTLMLHGKNMILFAAYVLMMAFHSSMQPLLNSVNVPFLYRGIVIDYGIGRGMGSVGYSIMSAALGMVVASLGTRALPVAGEICLVLMVAGLVMLNRRFHHAKEESHVKNDNSHRELKDITMAEFAKRHKLFLVITFGIFLMFYDHQIINFFMLQVFKNVGGTSSDMGIYYALMSFLEIPALMGFTWINKKFSTTVLLKVGVIGLILRALLMFFASSPLGVQLSLIVNPIGFPLFLGAIVKYINEIMNVKEAVRGQSMYVMVITISAVVASFTGGIVLDNLGAKPMLLICLVLCVMGAAIVLPLIDKAAKETQK